MIHIPYTVETFGPVIPPLSSPIQPSYLGKSISIFAVHKMHDICIFYSLWLLFAILCI